jgi:hypothetical protein
VARIEAGQQQVQEHQGRGLLEGQQQGPEQGQGSPGGRGQELGALEAQLVAVQARSPPPLQHPEGGDPRRAMSGEEW